ncbi:MAG: hypothetical protein Roseis2KO_01410 [Roseivirga sp.]
MIKSHFILLLFVSLLVISSCIPKAEEQKSMEEAHRSDQQAQKIVDRAITAHGGDLYKRSRISFTFRGKRHVVQQDDQGYHYERSFTEEGEQVLDVYKNGEFTRTVNGQVVSLSDRKLARYIEDVNGVSYFAMLPYKLNDAAVIKEYVGEVIIKGKTYDKIKVSFEGERGGDSPDNIFYYWFDQATGLMEYLGYNKHGNRFRAPYNPRVIKGIRFVHNVNFGGGDFSDEDISTYDKRYEAGELKELSRIILEDVEVELVK